MEKAFVVDRGDGAYEVHLLPKTAGAYLIGVTLHDEHIAGSRFVLNVSSASAHAPSCVASGRGACDRIHPPTGPWLWRS